MMTQNLTKLEEVTLDWVSHDYENVESIIRNVGEDMGTDVTASEIFLTLMKLHRKNLVSAMVENKGQLSIFHFHRHLLTKLS